MDWRQTDRGDQFLSLNGREYRYDGEHLDVLRKRSPRLMVWQRIATIDPVGRDVAVEVHERACSQAVAV